MAATFFAESTTAGPLAADESHYTGKSRTVHAPQGNAVATQTRGAHSVSGSIRKIDHNTGMINLETEVGVLEVQASPEAVQDWQEGDQVVLKFGAAE